MGSKGNTGKQEETHSKTQAPKVSQMGDLASEESFDFFLAKTIRSMEEMIGTAVDDECNTGDHVATGISDAQMCVLRAKLRIMQEELDMLCREYYKKDDENAELNAKMKALERDRAKLQKTASIQLMQIEKHRALADESARKSNDLQLQMSALKKEMEELKRSHKQAMAVQSTVEGRLNRALEETENLKTQLNEMKQMSKDKISEEHQCKENLLAETKMLRKQKEELVVGFKKQLKLIDILKRQKMHFEAAKLLSFTEEEFVKALDWGLGHKR